MSDQPKTRLEEEIEYIDNMIALEETKFEKAEAVKLLMNSETEAGKAFQLVILESYMVDEANRITEVVTTPDGLKKDTIETMMEKLVAIRHLRAFIQAIGVEATNATLNIEDYKQQKIDIKADPTLLDEVE